MKTMEYRILVAVFATISLVLACILIFNQSNTYLDMLKWGIKLKNDSSHGELKEMMRGQMLHHLMELPKASKFEVEKRSKANAYHSWTSFPTLHGKRHTYNPTWSQPHGVVLMRNDCLWKMFSSDCYYDHITVNVDSKTELPTLTSQKPRHLILKNNRGEIYPTTCRKNANELEPVFEDLRFAVEWKKNFNEKQLPLITGPILVSVFPLKRYIMTVIESKLSELPSLKQKHLIDSPQGNRLEKNWLFLQNKHNHIRYHVLYWCEPFTIHTYDKEQQTLLLDQKKVFKINYPKIWKYGSNKTWSTFRLSAICLVNNETQLMLILHKKQKATRVYVHYCIYLDPETFAPIFFIPSPVFSELGANICFIMSISCTKRFYHVGVGVSDEIGGIVSYDIDKWEALKIPMSKA